MHGQAYVAETIIGQQFGQHGRMKGLRGQDEGEDLT
jgi:hypothetical protein